MTVNLVQWRAVTGVFNCRCLVISKSSISRLTKNFCSLFESLFLCFGYFKSTLLFLLTFLHIFVLLRRHGDIELNPGPGKSKGNTVSVCHWNLNSKTAHNFSKLIQLKAYISTYKYDFICLSETVLDSSTPDNLVDIQGYNLVPADHPDNTERGEVCIYYKESLPVPVINLPYFKEALLLEMRFNKKGDNICNLSFSNLK